MSNLLRRQLRLGGARFSSRRRTYHSFLDVHPEVREALAHNKPVVALETALVSCGLPYPQNLQVSLALESIVRSTGSIPATIGLIGGRVKVGLEQVELERLATRSGNPVKISRRDIAAAMALGQDGGTTCSATLVFAALLGIKVFATGGLGGVHRGGENSLDISADLHELSRCPVGLVSSGVKSILDIKRTLEYLETLGVPVISYSSTKEFPAFFTRPSGHNVSWNTNDPLTAATILYNQHRLGMQNGALIAVPIPEEYEAVGEEIQKLVNKAVEESETNGIAQSGNDATPWLLNRIAELSQGKSLDSNIALLKNTALVGGQIAVKYQALEDEARVGPVPYIGDKSATTVKLPLRSELTTHDSAELDSHLPSANVVVIGAAAVDITAKELEGTDATLSRQSTVPGHVKLSLGGVGRNIAEATHRVMQAQSPSLSTLLLSPIGSDAFGKILSDGLKDTGMRTEGLVVLDSPSAVCNMVLSSDGSLVGGVADMEIIQSLTAEVVLPQLSKHVPNIVAVDGNVTPESIQTLVAYCNKQLVKVLFEPTSVLKSTRILPAIAAMVREEHATAPVTYCTPNLLELSQIYEMAQSDQYRLMDHPSWWDTVNKMNLGSAFRMDLEQLSRRPINGVHGTKTLSFLIQDGIAQKAINLLPFFQHLVIKCGDKGALVVMHISRDDALKSEWKHEKSNTTQRYVVGMGQDGGIVVVQHFPPLRVESLVSVTGAGDSFVGALLAALASQPDALYSPKGLRETITTAQKAAVLTLGSHSAVSPLLSELTGP